MDSGRRWQTANIFKMLKATTTTMSTMTAVNMMWAENSSSDDFSPEFTFFKLEIVRSNRIYGWMSRSSHGDISVVAAVRPCCLAFVCFPQNSNCLSALVESCGRTKMLMELKWSSVFVVFSSWWPTEMWGLLTHRPCPSLWSSKNTVLLL